MMHNQEVKAVETSEGSSDEMWSFVCLAGEVEVGDGWMGMSIAEDSGLILTAGVGKHTDELKAPKGRQTVRVGIRMAGQDRSGSCQRT